MAAITTFSPKNENYGTFFCLNTSYVSAQTNTEITSAISGISYYLKTVSVNAGNTGGTFRITTAPLGVSVNEFGPIYVSANTYKVFDFNVPLKCKVSSSLILTTEGVAGHNLMISGYYM